MTVYYYGIYNVYGGLERYAHNLISAILSHQDNLKYHLIVESDEFAYKKSFLSSPNVTYSVVPNSRRHPFAFRKKVFEVLGIHSEGDIFQINVCSFKNVFLFSAAKKSHIKTMIVGHLSSSFGGVLGRFLHVVGRTLYSSFGMKIAVDEPVAPYMFGRKKDVAIVHNGIDPNAFKYRQNVSPAIITNKSICAVVGRVSKQKNQSFALDVFKDAFVQKKYDLVLAGHAGNKRLMNEIEHKGKNRYLGELKDGMIDFYSSIDVLLVPSIKEGGLSLVVLEALASGCSVIINERIGRLPSNFKTIQYLPLSKTKWVDALVHLDLLPPSKRIEAYRDFLNTEYDLQSVAEKYWTLYSKLANQ